MKEQQIRTMDHGEHFEHHHLSPSLSSFFSSFCSFFFIKNAEIIREGTRKQQEDKMEEIKRKSEREKCKDHENMLDHRRFRAIRSNLIRMFGAV